MTVKVIISIIMVVWLTMIKNTVKAYKNNIWKLTCVLLLAPFILGGCGKSIDVTKSDTTAIYIGKDGNVISTIVEDFSASYYDLDEMKTMIEEEVSEYNSSKGQDLITFQDAVKEDTFVRVTMTYKNTASYAEFNNITLFCGSYEDMKAKGYSLPSTLVNSSGDKIDVSSILEDQIVVVMDEKIGFYCYDKIAYAPKESVWNGNKNVDLSAVEDDLCYIVLKAD